MVCHGWYRHRLHHHRSDQRHLVSGVSDRYQRARHGPAQRGGATFWTDAAVLGHAGIPSVVFGPGGAGLHGLEEHVRLSEVAACRDALVSLARSFCAPA